MCEELHLVGFAIISLALQEYIFEDVTQCQNANEPIILIHNYQSMYPGFSYSIKDGI